MVANMLKSLVTHGRIETTVEKAKELRRHADRLVTWAKGNTLADRRRAIAKMMVRYNTLTSQEQKKAKEGDTSAYNDDRKVISTLFENIGPRFAHRNGGYTRIIRSRKRVGDSAELCVIEYLPA